MTKEKVLRDSKGRQIPPELDTVEKIHAEADKVRSYTARLWNTYTPVAEILELLRLCDVARENELRRLREALAQSETEG